VTRSTGTSGDDPRQLALSYRSQKRMLPWQKHWPAVPKERYKCAGEVE